MLYFWLEFSTNTLENVQNVSLNSHDILVFCIHRASKNSIKCADVLQYFNPSTFINCTWSQKQRKMTIKTSKSRMMFAYNRAFAFYIHCCALFCTTFCLLYSLLCSFLGPDLLSFVNVGKATKWVHAWIHRQTKSWATICEWLCVAKPVQEIL